MNSWNFRYIHDFPLSPSLFLFSATIIASPFLFLLLAIFFQFSTNWEENASPCLHVSIRIIPVIPLCTCSSSRYNFLPVDVWQFPLLSILSFPPSDYLKFSSDYSHSVVGGTSSARGMRSASELRDLMDTLQRKKIALENSLRANGNVNPSYFSVTQVSHDLALHFRIYYFLLLTSCSHRAERVCVVSLDICLRLNMTNQGLLIVQKIKHG